MSSILKFGSLTSLIALLDVSSRAQVHELIERARELAYLFEVRKVEVSTPILFIDSDHRRFVLAK